MWEWQQIEQLKKSDSILPNYFHNEIEVYFITYKFLGEKTP